MTKKEWNNMPIGTRVQTQSSIFDETKVLVNVTLKGTVIRFNSNGSQCLVKWDERDEEIWYGRLGIELSK